MELTIATARLSAARILPHTPRAFYRTAINAFFFVMGMVFASWAVRIPDIKAALHMNDAALGSVLLASPLGEMLSIVPTAWLIARFRSRRVIMLGLVLMPCALLCLALAGSPHWLAAALLGFGFANNMLNISLNAQAVGVETLYGRSIMATFHGFALNVGRDLSLFDAITLCGLADARATSLCRERGDDALSLQEVKDVCVREFQALIAHPPVAAREAAL